MLPVASQERDIGKVDLSFREQTIFMQFFHG